MKLNLVIDGNYLLNKDVFILFGERTLYSDLPILLRKDIDKLLKMYQFDDIYFVADSKKRWRSKIYEQYKKNRTPNDKIDWDEVYQIYDDFKEYLKSKPNIHFYEIDWAEGDDLIAYIVNESNKKGTSNFIMASDNDIQQFLRFDLGLKYINIIYNYKISDQKTYLPKNYKVFVNEVLYKSRPSLFDMNNDIEFADFIDHLIGKTKITEIDNEELLFCKLITGDKKDNIPSVYVKKPKIESEKGRGIGKAGGLSIYKLYKETNNNFINFDDDTFIDKSTDIVSFSKKVTDTEQINLIRENLKLNRKLIVLTDKYVPSKLMDYIRKNVRIY